MTFGQVPRRPHKEIMEYVRKENMKIKQEKKDLQDTQDILVKLYIKGFKDGYDVAIKILTTNKEHFINERKEIVKKTSQEIINENT